MADDRKFFNCSEKYEIDYLASKFEGPKNNVVEKIKNYVNLK